MQKLDEVNGKLTVKVLKSDYEEKVLKSLKKLKQQAKMPGFRPGMVPMGLIQKMYGLQVKADEVEKAISEGINNYVKEQKLQLAAQPLSADGEDKIDIEHKDEFEMTFDMALQPEFSFELSDKDKIDYYNIEVGDKQIDEQVDSFRRRNGKFEEVESYEDGDMMRGSLTEVDGKGAALEGGLTVDETSIMPKYFSNEVQKKLFAGAKPGTDVTFNVSEAFDGKDTEISSLLKIKKEEVEAHKGDFVYHIKSVSRMKLAAVDQALFDSILGKDAVKSEQAFRDRIKEDVGKVYAEDSNYKFILDAKDYCLKKAGDLKWPEETMKREMLLEAKDDKQKADIEKDFKEILKDREWALICSKLMQQLGVKIDENTLKESAKTVAKSQFAQYGMQNVPDEYIENYAGEMLKDEKQYNRLVSRAIDLELTKAIKGVVKLNEKKISVEDSNKMFEK